MDLDKIIKIASIFLEASRKEYMREYMANRYHEKRKEMIEILGNKCILCGNDKGPFHIDHKNKNKKTFRAADLHSVSQKKIEKEKENFQLLCSECHKQKTKNSWDFSTPKPTHGTYWMYRRHGCRCPKCTKAYKNQGKKLTPN